MILKIGGFFIVNAASIELRKHIEHKFKKKLKKHRQEKMYF